MPGYSHIETYYNKLEELKQYGGSDNELSIRRAFENCLDAYCHDRRDRLVLVAELRADAGLKTYPDGTVRDSLRMDRGYWEAKDTQDDLDTEIRKKLDRGYPRDNIIFENSETAVLIRLGTEAMRVDMKKPADLHRLINTFLDYVLPEVERFREAWEQFKNDLPTVLTNLRAVVTTAEQENPDYQAAAADFLAQCHKTIGPAVNEADVREMLLQHILTKDIFYSVFREDQFHRENNIARQLDALENTFFTGPVRREAIDRLRSSYGAIGRAADNISDYSEKQQFLKAIYEDFYKAYNPAAADRLGVVYTPNEIVDFIIRGTDYLLQKHFGKTLADRKVQILDPATGTGTFITSLIDYLPADRLEYKYRHEIHANEVAILPYYIANLNIEYGYKEKTRKYVEFPNLCFVDTLDNLDWQGATEGAVQRQSDMNLGGLSEENWLRVQEQNEKPISVIIGNPPYNDSATLWGDGGANRGYPEIDQRIRDTYVKEGTAQRTHQYDMYKRFLRWASDRLDDDGIIGFISNSAFLDSRQDDGFRKVVAQEFNELWAIDLKGNARTSGERRRQEGGNVFDDKIRVGVAVYFLVRKKGAQGFKVFYNAVADYARAEEKVAYVKDKVMQQIDFDQITPDEFNQWLNQSVNAFRFRQLMPLAERKNKTARGNETGLTVFELVTPAVKSNRDDWVYDFSQDALQAKAEFFANTYNRLLDSGAGEYDPQIKWSASLRDLFQRSQILDIEGNNSLPVLWRPYVAKWFTPEPAMNDRLTRNHYEMFGPDLQQPNKVINFCTNGKDFYVLAADKPTDFHFTGDTQCLPLYRYTEDGERVCNITEWAIREFNDHARALWRDHFEELAGPEGITAEDIFAYTYAVLHDPVYRVDYREELKQGFPRLPFYHAFHVWRDMGRELLDLHLGFEAAEPWPLERVDTSPAHPEPVEGQAAEGANPRVILRADKERGTIVVDEETTLRGVPEFAWEYQLGNRTALEWVLDQYKEKKPRDPTIAEKFNTYKFADHKERVIDLLQRVCTVSVKTAEIVGDMAYWDGDDLIVSGDRENHEWETMASP